MTIHDFDMARFLLPDEPVEVFATASVLTDPAIAELDDFDSVSVILSTASGCQCTISNSRRAVYGYDQRVEVHGSMGMVSAENQRPVCIEVATKNGFERPLLFDFFMTRYTQAYALEISAFISGIASNQPLSPSGHDGLQALLLAQAASVSVAEKRAIRITELAT
jgi:myo-inositol 2-dehydrogenase/D-chiro-inositol 1-dehydrogenase